jgi:uncharacterized membrane protein
MLTLAPGRHPIMVHFPLVLIVTGAVWRALLGDAEGEVPGC